MRYFRKLITHRKLAAFLAIGMLLRSIVAVGYMLETQPADGSLLSITICGGPAGINAIAGLDSHAHHHGNHHSHHDNTNNKHDHAAKDHPISTCSFWSASSLSLLANFTSFDLTDTRISDKVVFNENNFIPQLLFNTRFARAPPALT